MVPEVMGTSRTETTEARTADCMLLGSLRAVVSLPMVTGLELEGLSGSHDLRQNASKLCDARVFVEHLQVGTSGALMPLHAKHRSNSESQADKVYA